MEGERRASELGIHDADVACVVAELARSLPNHNEVDARREATRDPWDISLAGADAWDDTSLAGADAWDTSLAGEEAWDVSLVGADIGGDGGLKAACADLDEEWAAGGGVGGGGGSGGAAGGRSGPGAAGVSSLGRGRQTLLRRLWASHRLRQEAANSYAAGGNPTSPTDPTTLEPPNSWQG